MRGFDGDGAEVMYALGYALERLDALDEARRNYEVVLIVNKQHEKVRAPLRVLAISQPPSR